MFALIVIYCCAGEKYCHPFLMADCGIIGQQQHDPEGGAGGFEVQGDKTKFATLQRQRKQLYDELRDSKCRAQVGFDRQRLLPPRQKSSYCFFFVGICRR